MGDWLKLVITWTPFHLKDPDSRMETLTFLSINTVQTLHLFLVFPHKTLRRREYEFHFTYEESDP